MKGLPLALGLWLGAYLLGSIPFGFVIARWRRGVDVRKVGSGNIGATNVARAAGRKLGILVLLLDVSKGLLPTWIAKLIAPELTWIAAGTAAVAFFGHIYPLFLRFRGGKGVATAFGGLSVLTPWAALAGAATWLLVYGRYRMSSLGSLLGVSVALVLAYVLPGPRAYAHAAALIAVFIVLRHRANIRRLIRGEELRV